MKTLLPLALVFALTALAQTSPRLPTAAEVKTYAVNDLDQAPQPISRISPKIPDAFKQLGVPGEALCRLTISENGDVTAVEIIRSSHPELDASAQAALLQWKFKPGQKDDQAVACNVEQRLTFPAGKISPRPAATGPRPTFKSGDPFETPESFFKYGEEGQVTLLINVSDKGRVTSVETISASHDELIEPAKATVMKWKYDPVIIDDKKAPSQTEQTVKFRGPRTPEERKIAVEALGKIYALSELDQPPSVQKQVNPLYPYEFLYEKKSGRVVSELVLSPKGRVIMVKVLNSTHKDFSASAETSLYQTTFKPGIKDGQPVASRLEIPIEFNAPK